MICKKKLAIGVFLLLTGLMSQGAHAYCYAFPVQYQYVGSTAIAKFEAHGTTCPQSSGNHWVEICSKLNGGNYGYHNCVSGYTYTTQQPNYIHLYNLLRGQSYTYRLRYQKTNGSLGVGMYGPMNIPAPPGSSGGGGGSSSGGSSGGSGGSGGGCPPDICG